MRNSQSPFHISYSSFSSRQEPSALVAMRKKNPSSHMSSQIDEETVLGLETSMLSNSDLLSETTNSEIHKKYLEDQRMAQIELAEFEMIERDLDNIAVSPLLMSTEVKFPLRSHQDPHQNTDIGSDHDQDIVSSEWSNKSAEYYIGGNYSSQISRKSQNRYQFSQTAESDHDPAIDRSDRDYGDESDNDPNFEANYPTNPESDYDDDNDDHELQEAVSVPLVAETQFIRVSHSQNPFQSASRSIHTRKEFYEDQVNITQGSIDDSVSWGTSSSPMQTAIRPRLSNDSSDPPNPKSRNSPAPSRYHTSHLSTGAIGDNNHNWDQKKLPPTSRKSPARSTSGTRQSQIRKSKESLNPNHETSKSKIIIDEDILIKAKKLEDEIATYQ